MPHRSRSLPVNGALTGAFKSRAGKRRALAKRSPKAAGRGLKGLTRTRKR